MNEKNIHVNGTILRTLNVIRGSRCGLQSLEFLFTGRIGHDEFMECIHYLSGKEYIKIVKNEFTDISLSANGIQVLRGIIADNCIEV